MPAGVWKNPERWRRFADAIAIALGLNLWVSVVLLPCLFVGALDSTPRLVAAMTPLPLLLVGLWRRADALLLVGFPSALLLPVALAPQIATTEVYGPIRLSVVAVSMVAYMFGASFFTSFYEPPAPENIRPLASSRKPVPERWRRRFRVYRGLTILSVVFPLILLWHVNFDDTNREFLRQMFPNRVAPMTTMLNLVVLGAWMVIYSYVFLGALKPHRTGDRDLVVTLAQLKAERKRRKPRPIFYVGVVSALGFMLLLLLSRYF